MTNIIDIYFDSVGSTATAPSKLWQWSKGQVVRINGLDLPTVYQVHFSNNPTLGTAEPVAVSGNMVSIPDIYLTTGEPVYLFIWLSDETSAETIRKGTIYVAKRSQPSGEYDPTAEQQTVIDGLIGSINTAVDTAEDYANSAQTYSGNAATSATEALNAKDAAQGYAEQASQTAQGVEILVNRAEDAADDAETAKQDVEQLKQAVEGLADDAESAKTDAETARGEAQGFAQTASTKASEASQSASQASQSAATATAQAQTATAKATEASQSAETATAKASEASASATTATAKASEASASASTATTAKNDAVTAKNAAVTAKTGAETARTGAEAAAQSVSASAAQIATNTSDITDLKEDLTDMSTDGIVPTARQLLSDKYAVDEEPYKYRISYSGDRMDDEIVGGTVAWNQFANIGSRTMFGITVSRVNESTIRVTGTISSVDFGYVDSTSSAMAFQTTHVYIVWVNGPSSASSYLKFHQGSKATPDILNSPRIFKYAGGTSDNCIETTATGDVDYTFHWNKIDLTKMFGAEVADAVYAMEQAEAGAGVAWFKKLFPNDYYEYCEPELRHVEGLQKHEMVGFNLWDEEWEVGGIKVADGTPTTANAVRSKNYSRILGGKTYYAKCGSTYLYFYDADKNYLEYVNKTNATFDAPSNACYFKLQTSTTYGTTYKNDICINLSWSGTKNGTYEPYVKHSYPLDSSLTLRGVPKLGDKGLYFDGDHYKADGTVERRYGIVDLGTLTWAISGSYYVFQGTLQNVKAPINGSTVANAFAEKYKIIPSNSVTSGADTGIGVRPNGGLYASDIGSAPSGYFLYELATPTTETAQSYTALQTVDANGTEEYVSTSIVPVGHYTKYYDDLRKKLDGLPWDLSMIAPIETGTTASQAYVVGKYFILDNQLCKAKTAIASGATFTLNTNYEVTTVADELYTALHS